MSSLHTRIPVHENPHYKKSGIKSYVWLLQKYGFKPSKTGPYYREASIHSHPDGVQKRHLGLSNIHELRKGHHQHHHSTPVDLTGSQSDGTSGSTSATGGNGFSSYILMKHVDAKGTTGKATSDDQQNDSLYLTPVTIGKQNFTVNLDFDTGSSDLWVWSTLLDKATIAKGKADGKHIFDPSQSTTMAGSTWQISYGDGSSASGTVVTDTLKIGGIAINNQAIECANQLSSSFQSGAGDGLLGLAMGNINTVQPQRVQTPVENMITQKDIAANSKLFTAYLGSWRDANEDDKGQSFYTFGYIDPAVLQHSNATEPYWTPLVDPQQGFWKFASTSVVINGKTTTRGGNTAIADTGTTLALVDDATCDAIYAAIPKAKYDSTNQGWVFPTSTTAENLPVVGFSVGGHVFNVGKEDLLFAETEPGWTYGGIQSRGDMTFDILGDTFLKGIYAVFDQGNMRFGAVQRIEKFDNLAPPQ